MKDRRITFLIRAMGVFLLFFFVQTIVSVAVALIVGLRSGVGGFWELMNSDKALSLLDSLSPVIVLISDVLTIAVLILWGKLKLHQPVLDYTGLRKPVGTPVGLLCAAAGIAANFWFALAINMLPWPQGWMTEYSENAAGISGGNALTLAAVVLAAPLCEELVFRGRIYGYLSQIIPTGAAVVLQAVLFGGLHAGKVWMIYSFCVGCVFGYVRKLTGSVRASLYMHVAFNATSGLFGLFAQRFSGSGTALLLTLFGSAVVFLLAISEINRRCRKEEAK